MAITSGSIGEIDDDTMISEETKRERTTKRAGEIVNSYFVMIPD